MDYWALIFLFCSILAFAFGVESITSSVSFVSFCFCGFFVALFVWAALYAVKQAKREG